MSINPKTLRFKMYIWYLGSLITLSIYFYVIVHLLMLPHSTHIFLLLLSIMAIVGLVVIYKITYSLTDLSTQIKTISSRNLDKRVRGVGGGEELEMLAQSFNQTLDNLHEAFKREQQFIGDMAHEMKTPIATLRTSLEISLSRERNNHEYKKVIEEAIKDTDRMTSTLKNVLDLAWAETPNEQKHPQKFNLSELVEEIADITEKLASVKRIDVNSTIEKNVFITGYREKLARALINIVENSVVYTETGLIIITLKREHAQVIISIKDTGYGVEENDLPHIFERFYRGKRTSKIFGSGLGLAIAKSMVTIHKGKIKVKSAVGKGTEFIILLSA